MAGLTEKKAPDMHKVKLAGKFAMNSSSALQDWFATRATHLAGRVLGFEEALATSVAHSQAHACGK